MHVLLMAPSRRAASETFIRANLSGFSFRKTVVFGDEYNSENLLLMAHSCAILLSKLLSRLGLLHAASVPAAITTWILVKYYRPNLILVDFGFHAVRVMEAAFWCQIPLVVHFRGSDASSRTKFHRLKSRYRRLFQFSSGVIAKNKSMKLALEKLGADPESFLISPSGANPDLFFGAVPASSPLKFLSVGRLVEKKGPLQTLQAFCLLKDLLPESIYQKVELYIVGDGPLRGDMDTAVRTMNLSSQVKLLGVLSQEQIAEQMRTSRAFVQHSMVARDGDSEGNPVAIMEAQLCGLPVISTYHAGIPDVVVDGCTGILVREGDVDSMANAMRDLVLEPSMAARLGAAGRKRVLQAFTIQHHWSQVSAFLESIFLANGGKN